MAAVAAGAVFEHGALDEGLLPPGPVANQRGAAQQHRPVGGELAVPLQLAAGVGEAQVGAMVGPATVPQRPDPRAFHGQAAEVLGIVVTAVRARSEEHTSELQSLMRISYAVFRLKKTKKNHIRHNNMQPTHNTENHANRPTD